MQNDIQKNDEIYDFLLIKIIVACLSLETVQK
jgi:hypothetical protein